MLNVRGQGMEGQSLLEDASRHHRMLPTCLWLQTLGPKEAGEGP